ncbi:SAM-dependent methyltransferase [Haloferula luteola]|uniref:SAM-dependent methyltransferase n=1 Tax=Haloferula luteola TaxID=595692 RepID=A0A840V4R7_9BACT|nr:class I SAM-dependent methyltransferase [Haloferula luteola]MBB5352563.1 SAM-dependent methyltransferase [Haloferula luteola]
MSDAVRELYSQRRYPALSHPEAHPGVLAASARCAGVIAPALPEACRVLELGCASGQHLLPLAERFPESQFVGVDFSDSAIRAAEQAARAARLTNIHFEHADLRDWQAPDEPFDYVIAHGLLSWIDDAAKAILLERIASSLADSGIACISYNTLPGWALRQQAVAMLPALGALTEGTPEIDPLLEVLESTSALSDAPYCQHLASIFRDLRRKGPEILPFDELAPVCDAFHFGQVLKWAGDRKLRYLGEAALPDNLPPHLPAEALASLKPLEKDPVLLQQTLDLLSGRTHRVSLFCRSDTALDPGTTQSVVLHFGVRLAVAKLPPAAVQGEIISLLHASLVEAAPSTRPLTRLMEDCAARLGPRWDPEKGGRAVSQWIFQAARIGWVELRAEKVTIAPTPTKPALSSLNLHFARQNRGLVDAYHRTCHFPDNHQKVVAALDGSRTLDELENFAREAAPDLDFRPWIQHLASRGLFPG